MTDSQSQKDVLPLQDVFWAMMAVDGSRAFLLGRDDWRQDIINAEGRKVDALQDFDVDLTVEVLRQAKSKGGRWSNPVEWNLWAAVHNGLLLPTLGRVLETYGNANLSLTYQEAEQFFSPLPYMIKHCREYLELKSEFHYQGKENDQVKKEWDDRLEEYFRHADMEAPLPEILDHLPDNMRRKADTSLRHYHDPKPENDSLIGRMICAYLATKGISWKKLGMDTRIESYLTRLPDAPASYEVKSLYARLLDVHVENVPQLIKGLPVLDYTPDAKIPLTDFSKLYRWYGTGAVVEMVKPDLVGASHLGFTELSAFCRHMEIRHGLDHHNNAVLTDNIKLFKDTQSLEKIGRLSLIQDIIKSTYYKGEQKGGDPLRRLATRLWSADERAAAWGKAARYVPESRSCQRDFSTFKSDIGNIIYCAGLFEERGGNRERAAGLKALAFQIRETENSLQSLGNTIGDKAPLIKDWVAQWEQSYPDSERTRIARFVQQTFGLAPAKPVSVKIDEINLGFKGSGFEPDKQVYHLKYREVKDTIETDIPLSKGLPKGIVKYNTATEGGMPVLEIKHSDGTQIRIPVPARGSYDIFGTTGSPHAGEIIGFGCSVHHASLAFILAELAAKGADRAALQNVADKFIAINPGKHHRKTLADFQVEQVWAAFEGKLLSYTEYLQKNPGIRDELLSHPGHEHTREYLSNPDKEPLAAAATRARLHYGYGDLYPHKAEEAGKIGARDSWYVTDVDARLKA